VVDEVGRLLDHALVALVERRHRQLDRLLPQLARTRADARLQELGRVRAGGPLERALRDRPPERGREARQRAV
jgi:hypothetical protein